MPESEHAVRMGGADCMTTAGEARRVREDLARLQAEVAGLLKAIETRDVIGQAKGILMERHKLTAEEAFCWLRHASQGSNVKLAQLSVLLAETGEWPPRLGGRQRV